MEIKGSLTEKAQYDLVLVKKALNHADQRAYAELMFRYRETVFFMINRMVPNKDDADDLTLEAFGKAFQNLSNYTETFAFSTWLFRIATNHCIDFLRKKKIAHLSLDKPIGDQDDLTIGKDIKTSLPDPEEKVIIKEKIKHLREVVEKLKPKYRELVEMRYFQELSYEEISANTGMPLGTVKVQLFRAREFLFSVMNNKQDKP